MKGSGGTKGTYKENNFLERKIVTFREWMGDMIVLRQCLFWCGASFLAQRGLELFSKRVHEAFFEFFSEALLDKGFQKLKSLLFKITFIPQWHVLDLFKCYGLNCVPQKDMSKSSPCYLWMWSYLWIGTLQIYKVEVTTVGPNPICLVFF